MVEEDHFGVDGGGGVHPVDGGFDLAAVGGVAAVQGVFVDGADQALDVAVGVFDDVVAAHETQAAQAHFAAGAQAEEFLGGLFHEVVLLDVEQLAGFELAHAFFGFFRVEGDLAGFAAVVGPVADFNEQRLEHGHAAGGRAVQLLAHMVFEQGPFVGALGAGVADFGAKGFDRFRWYAAAAQAAEGGHARVVPAASRGYCPPAP